MIMLKELKEKIDDMYSKYGNVDVMLDIKPDYDCKFDSCYCENEDGCMSSSVNDITELKDYKGEEVTGICFSNYVMEDKNWGKDDKNV